MIIAQLPEFSSAAKQLAELLSEIFV